MKNADWLDVALRRLIRSRPAATWESKLRISVRGSVYTLSRIQEWQEWTSMSEQDSSLRKLGGNNDGKPALRPHQLIAASVGLMWFGAMLFGEIGALSATRDRMECISAQEYSNSCPHIKQTW